MKTPSLTQSRKNSILSIISWIAIGISNNILYRYMIDLYGSMSDIITRVYTLCEILIIVIVLAYIIGYIFREIRHSFLAEGAIIRRFLPLIKVMTLGFVWITGGFYILDAIHINTSSILTGAGIG